MADRLLLFVVVEGRKEGEGWAFWKGIALVGRCYWCFMSYVIAEGSGAVIHKWALSLHLSLFLIRH